MALAPQSEESLIAKGRILTLLKSSAGGLPEPVFNDATDFSVCVQFFARFDILRKAGHSFPSARARYSDMMHGLGASQAQRDAAMDKFDEFAKRSFTNMESNRISLARQMENYNSFILMLGAFGLDYSFDPMKRQCPLALLIESREFRGTQNFEMYKRRLELTAAERQKFEEPDIAFASTTYVSKENRVPFP